MKPIKVCDRQGRGIPKRGVYLLSEGAKHLYVGRSNSIHQRLARHCRKRAPHNTASFAFLLARRLTGNLRATYTKGRGTRDLLAGDKTFGRVFGLQKERIRNMHVRYVEENNPTRQALLEIYVAVVLNTPYNDFDTH